MTLTHRATPSDTICNHPGCNRVTKSQFGRCNEHTPKAGIRKKLEATPDKRVVIAGPSEDWSANGSHMARQVSVAREPWL